LTLTDQTSTSFAYDDNAIPSITITGVQDDEAFETFRQTYCVGATVSGTPADILFEDGTTVTGASQTGQVLYVVIGGGTVQGSGSSLGKKMGWHGFVGVGKSTGSWTQSGNTWDELPVNLSGVAIEGTITIAASYFPTANFVTPAAKTLTATTTKYGAKVFF